MLILHSFIESAWPRVDQFLDRMGVRVAPYIYMLPQARFLYLLLSFSISLISLIPLFRFVSLIFYYLFLIFFYSSISLFFLYSFLSLYVPLFRSFLFL